MRRITPWFFAFIMLTCFPLTILSQRFIWDKDHKCQVYSNYDADIRTFTYKGGMCKNGLLNGEATMELFEEGKLYYTLKGNFIDGYATGNAEYNYADGVTFKGTVEKNEWKYGVYTNPGVYVYTGNFSESRKHGSGKMVYDNDGRVFESVFNMDAVDYTQGKWYFKDGSKFIAIKELSSNKEVVGWFYYPPGTKEAHLQYEPQWGGESYKIIKVDPAVPVKRYMPVGKGVYKAFDYNNEGPQLETAETVGGSNPQLEAYMYNDYIVKLAGYIKAEVRGYRVNRYGILDPSSNKFYPFLKNNANVSLWGSGEMPGLSFTHHVFCKSGVINNSFKYGDMPDVFFLKTGTNIDEVREIIKTLSYDRLEYTDFLKLSDKQESLSYLNNYLNVTGTAINQSGYLVAPQLAYFDKEGISFLPVNGVNDIYLFNPDRLSPFVTNLKGREAQLRSELRKKATEKGNVYITIPWSNIRSFEYSDLDKANNGYWLTINGEVINDKTKKRVADSHKVFVVASYAKLLMTVLNWVKNN